MQDTSIASEQEPEQHSIGHWIKTHKKQLIGVGFGITITIGAVVFPKNKEDASILLEELPEQPDILPDSIEVDAIAQENLTQPLEQLSPDNIIEFPSAQAEKIPKESYMSVIGVNKILNWVQITTGAGRYTCRTERFDGELFFKFKRKWHPVSEYITNTTEEMVDEDDHIFLRLFSG